MRITAWRQKRSLWIKKDHSTGGSVKVVNLNVPRYKQRRHNQSLDEAKVVYLDSWLMAWQTGNHQVDRDRSNPFDNR